MPPEQEWVEEEEMDPLEGLRYPDEESEGEGTAGRAEKTEREEKRQAGRKEMAERVEKRQTERERELAILRQYPLLLKTYNKVRQAYMEFHQPPPKEREKLPKGQQPPPKGNNTRTIFYIFFF